MTQEARRLRYHRQDIVRRIVITVLALVAYRLLLLVPIPGLDGKFIATAELQIWHRVSIAAIGMQAWFSTFLLAELAILFLPTRWTTCLARNGHADPFCKIVIVTALILSAVQGYGVIVAINEMSSLWFVREPDGAAMLVALASICAATAVIVSLARAIDVYGVGMGFWVMLAATFTVSTFEASRQLLEMNVVGAIPVTLTLAVFAATLGGLTAVVAWVLARRRMGFEKAEPVVWPVLLARTVYPWLAVIIFLVLPENETGLAPFQQMLMVDKPIGAIILAVVVALICMRYARIEGSVVLRFPAAVISIIAGLIASAAFSFGVSPLATAGQLVTLGAIGTALVSGIRQHWDGD